MGRGKVRGGPLTPEQKDLFEKNKNLVYCVYNKYHFGRGDRDDQELLQNGFLGLAMACQHYNPKYNFSSYAYKYILGEMIYCMKYEKRLFDRETTSLTRYEEDQTRDNGINPIFPQSLRTYITTDILIDLDLFFENSSYSENAKNIFMDYINGSTYAEIARSRGCSRQYVTKTCSDVIKKFKNYLELE